MRTGQFLDEPDDVVCLFMVFHMITHRFILRYYQIATANAVAVAKMARIDFPRLWYALCVYARF